MIRRYFLERHFPYESHSGFLDVVYYTYVEIFGLYKNGGKSISSGILWDVKIGFEETRMNSVPLFAIFALFYGCDAALQVVTVSGRLICCRCEKTGNADVPAAQPTNPFEDGDGCCARLGRSLVEIIEKNISRFLSIFYIIVTCACIKFL